ncbi:MAG: HPr(Ser) kinase/phosphatase [Zetaproteobacteria bacterium]|nr:MAG: HPr(Ser) kinase/phosphatase [Zetaproteobacteria bacterium]
MEAPPPTPTPQRITMRELLERWGGTMQLRLIAGAQGLGRYIDHPRIQKPSLAFAGFLCNLHDYRLQVIGNTELAFLQTLSPERRREVVEATFALRLAGVVITRGVEPPEVIRRAAEATDTPLLVTPMSSGRFMTDMTLLLSHRLAPVIHQHGVYLDIFGLGVLLIGASGIGKSEIGLELVARGHRLIADDVVQLAREGADVLVGRSPEALRGFMEIRGMGVIDIRSLFGAGSVTPTKRLQLVVELVHWDDFSEEERLAPADDTIELHGVEVARTRLPIRPGRSMAILVEVAARNRLLKLSGVDSNRAFNEALRRRIGAGTAQPSDAPAG